MVNPIAPHIRPWAENKTLTVVNFFGGPGTGKSTTAAELFALMKKQGFKVELLHEIAKDYVWERWDHIFREQDWISAHQHRLQRRLVGHDVDYVIIDSSLLLGIFYTPPDFPPSFKTFVRDVFDSYTNINFYLQRSTEFDYVQVGRNQTPEQAHAIDQEVLFYLEDTEVPFHVIEAGDTAAISALGIIRHLHTKAEFEGP
jgi:AAA domain